MTNTRTDNRIWDILLKLSVPAVIACAGAIIVHEIRISVIESKYISGTDAAEMERRLGENFPQPWLKEDIADIKASLKSSDVRLNQIEQALARLQRD